MVGSRKAKNIKKGENQMEDFTKIELTIKSRGGGAISPYQPQATERRMLSTKDSILEKCERWCDALTADHRDRL